MLLAKPIFTLLYGFLKFNLSLFDCFLFVAKADQRVLRQLIVGYLPNLDRLLREHDIGTVLSFVSLVCYSNGLVSSMAINGHSVGFTGDRLLSESKKYMQAASFNWIKSGNRNITGGQRNHGMKELDREMKDPKKLLPTLFILHYFF